MEGMDGRSAYGRLSDRAMRNLAELSEDAEPEPASFG